MGPNVTVRRSELGVSVASLMASSPRNRSPSAGRSRHPWSVLHAERAKRTTARIATPCGHCKAPTPPSGLGDLGSNTVDPVVSAPRGRRVPRASATDRSAPSMRTTAQHHVDSAAALARVLARPGVGHERRPGQEQRPLRGQDQKYQRRNHPRGLTEAAIRPGARGNRAAHNVSLPTES
jgi:hypothetical protein